MQYVILGLIQGLTEFLPVSSSGHLVISQYLLNIEIPGVAFEVFVHLGTSFAVIFLYRKEIKEILFAFLKSLNKLFNSKKLFRHIKEESQTKFAWLLLISTIPGALIGYYFDTTFEKLFGNPMITSFMLIITGCCLFFTDKYFIHGKKTIHKTTWMDAILIGFAQALAIIPGISRSGFTIMMALNRQLDREFAAKYSFILSVPIILGASIYKIQDVVQLNIEVTWLLTSGLTALLSGYWAMKFLIKILTTYNLRLFSYYLWVIGSLVILFDLIKSR